MTYGLVGALDLAALVCGIQFQEPGAMLGGGDGVFEIERLHDGVWMALGGGEDVGRDGADRRRLAGRTRRWPG